MTSSLTFRVTLSFALIVTLTVVLVLAMSCSLPRLFGRFVRLNPDLQGGNGLGLAICRSVLLGHQGEFTAENRSDRTGHRVTFVI